MIMNSFLSGSEPSAPSSGYAENTGPVRRVIVIEDQSTIRDGLCFLLDGTPGYHCVGRFRSMEEALSALGQTDADVALVDIGLPGMSGIDGIRLLKERSPRLFILMLTVYDDDGRIFQALCAGASGYLLKKTAPARLLDYIEEAMEGGAPMSPEVARRVIDLFRKNQPGPAADYSLTPHELRLLKFLAGGHTCKSAAAELGVSPHTINYHLRSIYEKLHVHSRAEAVAKVLRDRLI